MLTRTDQAIRQWSQHLETIADMAESIDVDEVESYIAQYVAVMLCNEFVGGITALLRQRIAASACDAVVASLAMPRFREVGSPSMPDVIRAIGRAGSSVKSNFEALVEQSIGPAGVGRINKLHVMRNRIAHGEAPLELTYGDVRLTAEDVRKVLEAAKKCLGITEEALDDSLDLPQAVAN